MSKTTKALAIMGVVAGLGVAALPMSTYAAQSTDSDTVTVKLEVEDFISCEVTTAGKTVDLSKVASNALTTTGDATVNIKTNNAQGYKAAIAAPATGDHKDQINMIGVTTTNVIEPGVPATAQTAGTKSAWGYTVSSETAGVTVDAAFDGGVYKGITASSAPQSIASRTGAKTAEAGDNITLTFQAYVAPTQNADVYTGYAEVTATAGQA